MRSYSYINSAKEILASYVGDIPFAAWLKTFFKEHKKFGSRDRKIVSDLCFCYFRLGQSFASYSIEEKLLIGQLLCHSNENLILSELKPEWTSLISRPISSKLDFLNESSQLDIIFPFRAHLSDTISATAFNTSMLVQPDLFIRIRPGKRAMVLKKLTTSGISYHEESENCLRFPNATKIEEVLQLDREVVIQDLNSQKVLDPLNNIIDVKSGFSLWDCCAASGGKSILATDRLGPIKLNVSDVRTSIIHNLKKRFEQAGIYNFHSFTGDLSTPGFKAPLSPVDFIICDAPCSGSGTWGRTPEQLIFFQENRISHYVQLQQSISLNAVRYLKKGGYFLYITCSVFKDENENVVSNIQNNTSLELLQQNYFTGYHQKADTLFTALFKA